MRLWQLMFCTVLAGCLVMVGFSIISSRPRTLAQQMCSTATDPLDRAMCKESGR